MPNVIIYTTSDCSYCQRAKDLLDQKNVQYTEINVEADPKLRDEMVDKSDRRTVPQIFIGETHVGGFDDLYALETSGELDNLLK